MKKWTMMGLVLVLATAVTVTALAIPKTGGKEDPAPKARQNAYSGSWHGTDQWKYTQADYQMALDLKSDGYEKLSVGEFDKLVADWSDEEVFHQRAEALQRLKWSYGAEKENADFIRMTLMVAFDACSVKHYGGYCTSTRPSYSDGVSRVREEDVFGDKYPVFQAELDYTITYQVPDETKLTVGERESLLLAYRAAMQKFLDGKTEKELLNDKTMKTALERELARLDQSLSTEKMTLLGTSLDYYYAYDEAADSEAEVG